MKQLNILELKSRQFIFGHLLQIKDIKKNSNGDNNDNGEDYAKIGSSGYSAKIGSSGNSAQIGSSGNSAQIGRSGNSAQIEI